MDPDRHATNQADAGRPGASRGTAQYVDAVLGRAHPTERIMGETTELSVRYVTPTFGGQVAVDLVSFDVERGELVALLGASGSGKTTSLRIVAGYELPDRGTIRFDGEDITRFAPEKRGFGMVFQHYALFPHMSVAENVA